MSDFIRNKYAYIRSAVTLNIHDQNEYLFIPFNKIYLHFVLIKGSIDKVNKIILLASKKNCKTKIKISVRVSEASHSQFYNN